MDSLDNNKVVFIISHKYFKGYESYLNYYIQNIINFYDNFLILIVDNNSLYKDEIFNKCPKLSNVVFLDNNIECKFEIGAYQIGLKYLIDNDLYRNYNYIVMTQDNFVLNNRYDFDELYKKNVTACTINSYFQDGGEYDIMQQVLINLGINDNLENITFCWCCSFIISTSKIEELYNFLKQIVIKTRRESCAAERYLARIIWELNNKINYDIDGDIRNLSYNCWDINIFDPCETYFAKKVQQKTENTIDKL